MPAHKADPGKVPIWQSASARKGRPACMSPFLHIQAKLSYVREGGEVKVGKRRNINTIDACRRAHTGNRRTCFHCQAVRKGQKTRKSRVQEVIRVRQLLSSGARKLPKHLFLLCFGTIREGASNLLTKNAPKNLQNISSLYSVGPKKNSHEIPARFPTLSIF